MSVELGVVQLSLPEETDSEEVREGGTWIKRPPFEPDESDYDLRRRIQAEQGIRSKEEGQLKVDSKGVRLKRGRVRKGVLPFHPIDGSSGMRDVNKRAAIVASSQR